MPILPNDLRYNTKINIKPQWNMCDSLEFIPIVEYIDANQYLDLIFIVIFLKLVFIVYLWKVVYFVQKLSLRVTVYFDRIADLVSYYVLANELDSLVYVSHLLWGGVTIDHWFLTEFLYLIFGRLFLSCDNFLFIPLFNSIP